MSAAEFRLGKFKDRRWTTAWIKNQEPMYADDVEAKRCQSDETRRHIMLSDQFEEIMKGIMYSQEPQRLIAADNCRAILNGHHRNHVLVFVGGEWHCSCDAWQTQYLGRGTGWCRHTIAVTRILTAAKNGTALVPQAEAAR